MVKTHTRTLKSLFAVSLCLAVMIGGCGQNETPELAATDETKAVADDAASEATLTDDAYDSTDCDAATEPQQKAACDLFDEAQALSGSIVALRDFAKESEYLPKLRMYAEDKRDVGSLEHSELYRLINTVGSESQAFAQALESSDFENKALLKSEAGIIDGVASELEKIINPLAEGRGFSDPSTTRAFQCEIIQSGKDDATVKAVIDKHVSARFKDTVGDFCQPPWDDPNFSDSFGVLDIETWGALNMFLAGGQTQMVESAQVVQNALTQTSDSELDVAEPTDNSGENEEPENRFLTILVGIIGLIAAGTILGSVIASSAIFRQELGALFSNLLRNKRRKSARTLKPGQVNSNIASIPTNPSNVQTQMTEQIVKNIVAANMADYVQKAEFEKQVKALSGLSKASKQNYNINLLIAEVVKSPELEELVKQKVKEAQQTAISEVQVDNRTNQPQETATIETPFQGSEPESPQSDSEGRYDSEASASPPEEALSAMPLTHSAVTADYNSRQLERKDAHDIVAITSDSQEALRLGQATTPILTSDKERGTYWVINRGPDFYLIPKTKFNSNSIQPLSTLYDYPDNPDLENPPRLIRPAMVVPAGSGRWQLTRKGALSFG